MSEEKFDVLGPIFAHIGGELAEIVGGSPDGTFLYAEAGDGWYGYSVFKPEGDHVRYFSGTPELGDLIKKAWSTEETNKRWAVMQYQITGTHFVVEFQFPEELDPNETEMDRRPRALKKHFGDKPVIYPLPPNQ